MEAILLLAVIALAVVARRQATRLAAIEEMLRRLESPPTQAPAAARVVAPPAVDRHVVAGADRSAASTAGTRTSAADAPRQPPPAATDGGASADHAHAGAGAIFEQLVGARLPIWAGGAALAVAGYFLVRLAIESGLLTPAVRVALASLAGFALVGIGEAAARLRPLADDPRVHQALSGAGLATLYAAAYLAGSHYGLVGPAAGFAMMAAVTALALGLSLRRGAPTALMGLVGGFATPLLAGAEGQAVLPLLLYLGLLSAGLFGLAAVRGWLWLALAAAAASLLWSGLLIATAATGDAVAAGGFAVMLAVAATLALAPAGGSGTSAMLRAAPIAAAAAELALLIAATGFGVEAWALYLLLSAATIVLAWREPRLTPAVAAVLALSAIALAAGMRSGADGVIRLAAGGIVLLFGGAGHALARRRADGARWSAIGALGLVLPYAIVRHERATLALLPGLGWSAAALLLALAPLHLAWRSRSAARAAPPFDLPLQVAAATAAGFLAVALARPLPPAMLPAAILLAAAGLAEAARAIGDGGVRRVALAAGGIAAVAMAAANAGLLAPFAAALTGERFLLALLPPAIDALTGAVLPAALILLLVARAGAVGERAGRALLTVAFVAAAAGLYILWKQVFAIADTAAFVRYGFVERAILSQALFAGGWLAAGRGRAIAARALTAAAALRVLWFDLGILDPAFVVQQVGPWPVANLLVLHFLLAAFWTERAWRREPAGRGRALALAALLGIATGGTLLAVRQAFHGLLPALGPVGRGEFYAYSAAAILLAVALFGWGAKVPDRALRVAGLGLLAAAALKVFLVDAAALSGLLRVASFLGLGVTLIGIGWAYGRFPGGPAAANPAIGP